MPGPSAQTPVGCRRTSCPVAAGLRAHPPPRAEPPPAIHRRKPAGATRSPARTSRHAGSVGPAEPHPPTSADSRSTSSWTEPNASPSGSADSPTAHYRIRALLYAGRPYWALPAAVTPRQLPKRHIVESPRWGLVERRPLPGSQHHSRSDDLTPDFIPTYTRPHPGPTMPYCRYRPCQTANREPRQPQPGQRLVSRRSI